MAKHHPLFLIDRSVHRPAPAYPQEIHEHRAPTDDSVRLLAEMEEKAMQRILGRIGTENNTIATQWLVLREPANFMLTFRCVYTVNGERRTFSTEKDVHRHADPTDLLKEVFREFLDHFALEFLPPLIREATELFNALGGSTP